MNRRIILALALLPLASLFSFPEVKPNNLFADNAVLQSDVEVPVWGTARDGEQVTVQFAGQRVTTMASHGHWMSRLKRMQANATPRTMTITGDNKITISNVVVGEVWIASGQSNMERMLGPTPYQKPIDNWEQEVATADFPLITSSSNARLEDLIAMIDPAVRKTIEDKGIFLTNWRELKQRRDRVAKTAAAARPGN